MDLIKNKKEIEEIKSSSLEMLKNLKNEYEILFKTKKKERYDLLASKLDEWQNVVNTTHLIRNPTYYSCSYNDLYSYAKDESENIWFPKYPHTPDIEELSEEELGYLIKDIEKSIEILKFNYENLDKIKLYREIETLKRRIKPFVEVKKNGDN